MASNPYNDPRYLAIKAQYHRDLFDFWSILHAEYTRHEVQASPNDIKSVKQKIIYHRKRYFHFLWRNRI